MNNENVKKQNFLTGAAILSLSTIVVKVIGINNSSICSNVSPRLTSVDFQLDRLGDLLVGRLLRHCDDPGLPREDVILPVRIEERNSCPAVSIAASHPEITIN